MSYLYLESPQAGSGSDFTVLLPAGTEVKQTGLGEWVLDLAGITNQIIINGTARSTSGGGLDIVNTGGGPDLVTVSHEGAVHATATAVRCDGNVYVQNLGHIVGTATGAEFVGTFGQLDNEGSLKGGTAVVLSGDSNIVTNGGRLIGQAVGVNASGVFEFVANHGRIAGNIGLTLGDYAKVNNDGLIKGSAGVAIQGGTGVQHVLNRGVIRGNVELDANNDYYIGRGHGRVTGTIDGGDGVDQIFGSRAGDHADGGAGNDSIFGGSGDDVLRGGADGDEVGGDGGDDRVFGDAGNDTLHGGGGDDRLHGGDGNDTLIGDRGDDHMFGDAGNDTFKFLNLKNGKTVIHGWEDGGDKIDLIALTIADHAQFVADAVSNHNGNAVIDLSFGGGHAHGIVVVKGAAHMIDVGDFSF